VVEYCFDYPFFLPQKDLMDMIFPMYTEIDSFFEREDSNTVKKQKKRSNGNYVRYVLNLPPLTMSEFQKH